MEDREFDEIMNKYVASTGRDAEFDLAKLRQKENAGNKAGAVRHARRFAWASVAAVLIVAVVLAVALPLTLGGGGENTSSGPFYCDDGEVLYQKVDVSVAESEYGIDVMETDVEDTLGTLHMLLTLSSDNTAIGVRSEYGVFNENFDSIVIFSIKDGYVFVPTQQISLSCVSTTVWRDIPVKYGIKYDEEMQCSRCCYEFSANGMNYFVQTTVYGDFTAEEILDLMF